MKREACRLVNDYSDLIMRLSFTYLGSTHDAEDICQDVHVKLMTSQTDFKNREHEKAWVIRVTINACKDLLRSSSKRSAFIQGDVESRESGDANQQFERFEENLVAKAVGSLPENQREAIYLHYFEGYKIEEIARLTQSSSAAVAKRLSRARETLRVVLGGSKHE